MIRRILFYLFVGVFGLLFIGGVAGVVQTRQLLNSHVRVQGTIVEVDQQAAGGGGLEFTPIIQFKTAEGETWQFRSSVTSSSRPVRGTSIEVLYDPNDPSDAVEDTFAALWSVPVVMLVIGTAGLSALTLLARRSRRRQRAAQSEVRLERLNRDTEVVEATFSHVQPRGPDEKGSFQYRVVAVRKIDGVRHTYQSEWLDENPTVPIMQAGNRLRVRLRPDGSGRVLL